MTRQQVLDLIYGAETMEQCNAAEAARFGWLEEHPDDEEVRESGESLVMLRHALEMMNGTRPVPPNITL